MHILSGSSGEALIEMTSWLILGQRHKATCNYQAAASKASTQASSDPDFYRMPLTPISNDVEAPRNMEHQRKDSGIGTEYFFGSGHAEYTPWADIPDLENDDAAAIRPLFAGTSATPSGDCYFEPGALSHDFFSPTDLRDEAECGWLQTSQNERVMPSLCGIGPEQSRSEQM